MQKVAVQVPGLLFIDTPGHHAFTTLRARGGALADMAINSGMGASVDLSSVCNGSGVDAFTALFSESQGRVILAVPEGFVNVVYAAASAEGVSATRFGTTGGDLLAISLPDAGPWAEVETLILDVAELAQRSDAVLRELFDE